MSDGTKIEWADATVNAINGCSLASPGCTNCYAMRLAGTRLRDHPSRSGLTQQTKVGPVWTGEVRLSETALLQPLRWKRPRRIFWNAHGDTFHDAVPDEWLDRLFAVCALTPQHTHMILTKRGARMREYFVDPAAVERIYDLVCNWAIEGMGDVVLIAPGFPAEMAPDGRHVPLGVWPLPNVWLGVSVEDQARADERIPDLLATPAAVRFISAEPLLGPVNLFGCSEDRKQIWNWLTGETGTMHFDGPDFDDGPKLDWVIVGGESGPSARPMHPDCARSLRDQCAAAGVAFHFKQWGEWVPIDGPRTKGCFSRTWPHGERPAAKMKMVSVSGRTWARGDLSAPSIYCGYLFARLGKKAAGRQLDGVEHNGFPA